MWHTPFGDRVIDRAEAELIKASVAVLVEAVIGEGSEGIEFRTGIQIFDHLTWTHKLAAIELVTRHLLTDTSAPLELTAINESVVGAIFEMIRVQTQNEIDFDDSDQICDARLQSDEDQQVQEFYSWRELLLNAATGGQRPQEDTELGLEGLLLPAVTCSDMSVWNELIESLADQILWDRDYEMAETFMDDDPSVAQAEKALFGIEDDYFTDLPPDLRDDQVETALSSIEQLIRSKPH